MALNRDFENIVSQFKSKSEYEAHLAQSEKIYELKVYRVGSITRQQALTYYRQLHFKYLNRVYERMSTGWHENERRLFVWFIVCYSKWNKLDVNQEHVWDYLAGIFFNKDPRLLKYQFMNVIKRKGRVQWTAQQDEILRQSYNRHPNSEWNQIAKELFFLYPSSQTFKTPKNCRQRWNNHLNNEVKKQPFTEEEDREMLVKIKQKGKKWSVVAKDMGSKRTEHQIKNRWNSLITQFIRSLMTNVNTSNNNDYQLSENNESKKSNNNKNNQSDDKEPLVGGELNQEQILQRILVQIQKRLEGKSQTHQQLVKLQNSVNYQTSSRHDNNFTNAAYSNLSQTNTPNVLPSPSTTNHALLSNNQMINHSNFSFLSTINVVTEHQTPIKLQHPPPSFSNTNHRPILIKPSFESNVNQQDKKQPTSFAMKFINCGLNKNNILDKEMAAVIQDKLFGSVSQYKSDISWMDKHFKHTPCGFFEQSSCQQKKMSEFRLSRPSSFQNSQLANSIQMFKLPRSDMSQQYRILTSSMTIDTRVSSSMNYQLANDLKQL